MGENKLICLKEITQKQIRFGNIKTRFSINCPYNCEYRKSCQVLAGPSPENHKRMKKAYSFDQCDYLYGEHDDSAPSEFTDVDVVGNDDIAIESMQSTIHFLAFLDSKTLTIILHIIRNRYVSVHRLAKDFQVADGTILRAIFTAIEIRPELRYFFEKTLTQVKLTKRNPFRNSRPRDLTPFLPGFR